MDVRVVLGDIGLNNKEIDVYLALLKLGEEGASRVASFTNLNRVTVYSVLESLKGKGFIHSVVKQNTTKFVPKKPKEILNLLRQKEDRFGSVLSDLEGMQGEIKTKSAVTLFEGKKRIVELMNDVFSYTDEEVLSYGNMKIAEGPHEDETINLRKLRLEKGMRIRCVTDKDEHVSIDKKKYHKLSKFRILKDMERITTWTYVFGNKVAITSLQKELNGILIESEEFANTQRVIFELLWNKGKEVKG